MKSQDANLQLYEKELFHTSSFMYFAFIFSEYIKIISSKDETTKCERTISFWKCKWKVMLLLIYLINYNSSKSTFFMLNYGIWRSLGYSFCQINWNSSFLAIICLGNKSPVLALRKIREATIVVLMSLRALFIQICISC